MPTQKEKIEIANKIIGLGRAGAFTVFGGRDREQEIRDFQKQLQKGTKVEMEHTKDKRVAEQIARDHLAESPRYYVELAKMEKKLKRVV